MKGKESESYIFRVDFSDKIFQGIESESYIFQGDFSEEVHLDQLPEECNDQPGNK